MRRLGTIATALVVLALALLFLGERVVAHGPERLVLAAIGGVLLLAGLAARGARAARAPQPARRAERVLLAAKAGVTVALVLYALTTPALGELAALGEEAGHRVRTALGALWPAVLAVSLAALLFMELAYRKMPVAEAVELRRVRGAGLAGTGLALALVFLFSVNYATSEEDIRKDLSYFRTTRPSESTQQMVRQLGEPLRAVLFYPEVNEVLGQLRPYFETLEDRKSVV